MFKEGSCDILVPVYKTEGATWRLYSATNVIATPDNIGRVIISVMSLEALQFQARLQLDHPACYDRG